ncbi:hypothetical protein AOCH_007495 [Aspergillus ochraceoroseus]|uniref:Uncharacterized protein n=1 Tax=Aspergillus ochraceoroseus TaxID=138278 RepID=A0A0F8W836_9EURO|nr:hypothetical protein AOCH_007495 [Aspergillus ochraceoroseus]
MKISVLYNILLKASPQCLDSCPEPLKNQDIARVSVAACATYACRGYQMFAATVADIEAALNPVTVTESELREQLPPEFTEFYDVFLLKEAERLPPHQSNDHEIKLLPGKTLPFGSLYGMSRDKLKVLKEWIKENLRKGFICPSSSPAVSPILFVKKPGGGL